MGVSTLGVQSDAPLFDEGLISGDRDISAVTL
jgi:hypothetical protein